MSKQIIPKNIFTYWSGPKVDLVEKCIQRMRDLHPDWNVTVLNSIEEPCEGLDNLSVQHKSDWARICAIQKYGGVWLDATCICTRPVTEWVDVNDNNLQGFCTPFHINYLENWAFAAPTGNILVTKWKNEFKNAIQMGFKKYKEEKKNILGKEVIYDWMPYLTMHACYIIINKDTGMKALLKSSCDGPYKYLCDNNWNSKKAVEYLFNKPETLNTPSLIKIRGDERKIIENYNYNINSNPNSVMYNLKIFGNEKKDYTNIAIIIILTVVILTLIFNKYMV